MALICTKCRSVSAASSRAMVVLPTPGGPQKTSDDSAPEASMAPSGASRAQHLLLPDHLGQRFRAQPVGQRPGRGIGQVFGRVEQIGHGHDATPSQAEWKAARGCRQSVKMC